MQAQRTQESAGVALLRNRQTRHGLLKAFHMPSTCQLKAHPAQDWDDSHRSYNQGRNDGFADSFSGPVSMGYWDGTDIPFYYGLGETFPLCDRWFCSTLAQTPRRPPTAEGTDDERDKLDLRRRQRAPRQGRNGRGRWSRVWVLDRESGRAAD